MNAVLLAPHITSTPGVCGGKPCVAGTRIRVWDIACFSLDGHSVEEILEAFPRLTLADVYGALTYYYDHREEIDRRAAEDDRYVEELRKETGPGPLEKLLADEAAALGKP